MIETLNGVTSVAEQTRVQNEKFIDKIFAAAEPGVVFGAPVVSGAYTVISASEVVAGGGFGFGTGIGPTQTAPTTTPGGQAPVVGGGGGGGGGGSTGRPVAAIVIGPDGVKVQPIVDTTKIALGAITAWGSVAFLAMRLARAGKR